MHNNQPLLGTSWLQLDADRQLLYGLPTSLDTGSYSYKLTATDRLGATAYVLVEVDVVNAPSGQAAPPLELEAKFQINYQLFMMSMVKRLELTSRLAGAFGDRDPSQVSVLSIREGSVVFVWTNSSLPTEPCPADQINDILDKMVDPATQQIRPEFHRALHPYKVLNVSYKKTGSCRLVPLPPGGTVGPSEQPPGVVSKPSETSDNSMFVATVVPAVVIALLVLVAVLVACCLYRRRRKGSADLDPALQVRKGAPVIFADELEEAQDSSRTPLMLPQEKPPQPPPEYPRSTSGSLQASPPASLRQGDSRDQLYSKPPPFYSDSYAAGPSLAGPPPPPPYAHIPP